MALQGRELSVPAAARIFGSKSAAILNFSKFLKQSVYYLFKKLQDHQTTIRPNNHAQRELLSHRGSRLAGGFSDLEIFLTEKFFFWKMRIGRVAFQRDKKKPPARPFW